MQLDRKALGNNARTAFNLRTMIAHYERLLFSLGCVPIQHRDDRLVNSKSTAAQRM
ncbi:MAG: hypothetical protein WB777_09585 [Mycobacterium sp.]